MVTADRLYNATGLRHDTKKIRCCPKTDSA